MLNLQHVSKSFGAELVIDNVNISIQDNEITALIGENGAGKTTLLNILRGQLIPDTGKRTIQNESIGYVSQELEKTTDSIADSLKTTEEWRLLSALEKVGLNNIDTSRKISSLSGGQRTRLALAHVLAVDPSPTLLLFDEPTNNLDADGLIWLENFIKRFEGSVLIVSHDRAFINAVANHVWELKNGILRRFGGNYDDYVRQIQIEQEAEQREYEENSNQRQKITQLIAKTRRRSQQGSHTQKNRDNDKFLRNFKNEYVQNSFGGQAKALQTRLSKMETIERPLSKKSYAVHLGGNVHSSKLLLELKNAKKEYDGRIIIDDLHLAIWGNQRIHIAGPNGAGKSTLLAIAAGATPLDNGERVIGANVTTGYLSQDIYNLDMNKTGLENLATTQKNDQAIYFQAKIMGMSSTSLHKLSGQLSRGQQAKLGFAKLLLSDHQLLILDEPTNHLDITTRERIEEALKSYNGGMIVTSHDRHFIDKLKINHTVKLSNDSICS